MGLAVGTHHQPGCGNALVSGMVAGFITAMVLGLPWLGAVALMSALQFGWSAVALATTLWIGTAMLVGVFALLRVKNYQTWVGWFSMYVLLISNASYPLAEAITVLSDP